MCCTKCKLILLERPLLDQVQFPFLGIFRILIFQPVVSREWIDNLGEESVTKPIFFPFLQWLISAISVIGGIYLYVVQMGILGSLWCSGRVWGHRSQWQGFENHRCAEFKFYLLEAHTGVYPLMNKFKLKLMEWAHRNVLWDTSIM